MATQDVTDGGIEDGVVRRQDAPAGEAEDDLDMFHLQAFDEAWAPVSFMVTPDHTNRVLEEKSPPVWEEKTHAERVRRASGNQYERIGRVVIPCNVPQPGR